MAHYVAELIQAAEKASSEEQPAKMRACSEAILSLWKHRYELPSGKRPFEDLEPILRTVESLDPENRTPRYFRSARAAADEADEEDESESWLKLVDSLDYSARLLIRYCLTQAAETARDKSAEWVALADAAGADDGIEIPILRLIIDEDNLTKKFDPNEAVLKLLENRINRLEGFTKMANTLLSDLKQRVQELHETE